MQDRCLRLKDRVNKLNRLLLAGSGFLIWLLVSDNALAAKTIHLSIDEKASRPLSSLIFGQNQFYGPSTESNSALNFPLLRFGGNAASRYNWRINSTNTGKDWFFINTPLGPKTPNYVDKMIAKNGSSSFMINLPFIGWVAKSREKSWAYSRKKYGKQQAYEPYGSKTEIGNGIDRNGSVIKDNQPSDTSIAIDEKFHLDWISHLLRKTPASNFIFALGNEPTLWDESHRDLRYGDKSLPNSQISYDELWERTVKLATAIKKKYPDLKLAGPGSWGWCGYFSSGVDRTNSGGCTNGQDRKSHGGIDILSWYLKKSCTTQKSGPLIDYLDVHFYPEGLDQSDESMTGHRKRFSRLRSLFDESYTDPSWINQPVALLPRMQRLIDKNCPGTKLSLSEYRFGTEGNGISTALTQIAALGIFAEQGLTMATHFHELEPKSLLDQAFALYLNFDGAGSNILGSKVLNTKGSSEYFRSFTFKKANSYV